MRNSRIALIAGALCLIGGAYAQVIDQNQPIGDVYMAAFAQTDLAQSFKQTANDIDGAGILTQASIGGGDTITISLYDNLPTNGGNLLASGSASNCVAGTWVDVFWSDVSITSGQTYYLVFTSDTNTMGIAGSTNNPYADGQVYANPGFSSFPNFDYAFRTYAAPVPEPATLAALGLGALVVLRRKRK